jgi:hypothetical protein
MRERLLKNTQGRESGVTEAVLGIAWIAAMYRMFEVNEVLCLAVRLAKRLWQVG